MKTQNKILIDNVYANLEEMGIDIDAMRLERSIRVSNAQGALVMHKTSVKCPFCDKLFRLSQNAHRQDIRHHIECDHPNDIRH